MQATVWCIIRSFVTFMKPEKFKSGILSVGMFVQNWKCMEYLSTGPISELRSKIFICCDFCSASVGINVTLLVAFYKKSYECFKKIKWGLPNFVTTKMKYNIYHRNDLGLVYESCERFDEAIDCFTTSLELEQTAPIVSYTSLPRLFKAYDNAWRITSFRITETALRKVSRQFQSATCGGVFFSVKLLLLAFSLTKIVLHDWYFTSNRFEILRTAKLVLQLILNLTRTFPCGSSDVLHPFQPALKF